MPNDATCFSLQPFGHPTAGASLSRMGEGEPLRCVFSPRCSKWRQTRKGQVGKPQGRSGSPMPNISTSCYNT
ncbi:MAG: hypothetical protein V7L25_06065 [Nostoc sp.]